MNKTVFLILLVFHLSLCSRDGGSLDLQLGKITFGLGGSSKGRIIRVGPSPVNNVPISIPIVHGGCECHCNTCK